MAGATKVNETSLATNQAALTAASGYIFLNADGGTPLTATTAAALFSTTQATGKWAIAAGTSAQTELLIETGATTTQDSIWAISESSAGVFSAIKIAVVGVVATHDVGYTNFA